MEKTPIYVKKNNKYVKVRKIPKNLVKELVSEPDVEHIGAIYVDSEDNSHFNNEKKTKHEYIQEL